MIRCNLLSLSIICTIGILIETFPGIFILLVLNNLTKNPLNEKSRDRNAPLFNTQTIERKHLHFNSSRITSSNVNRPTLAKYLFLITYLPTHLSRE